MEGHFDCMGDACYFVSDDVHLCREGDVVRLLYGVHAGELTVFRQEDGRCFLRGPDFSVEHLQGLEAEMDEAGFFRYCWALGMKERELPEWLGW